MAGSVNKVTLVGNLGKDPEIRRLNNGDPVVNLSIATSETWRDMAERYKQAFFTLRGNGLVDEPLYEGMAAVLSELDENGWLLGVATGKSDRGLERCLDHHGIKGLFVTLQTADRHPSKPHPSMVWQALADAGADAANAVMIGDTVYDIHMGKAAGCRTIGVNWGYHPIDELREAGADHLVESMEELMQAIKGHL